MRKVETSAESEVVFANSLSQSNEPSSESAIMLTPRMQQRTLIGDEYYQMTKIDREEAKKFTKATGLTILFDPEEQETTVTLGEGHFGKIKLAFRKSTGEYVASKKITGLIKIAKSRAEYELQKEVAGTNVLPIYNCIEVKDRLYIFTKFAELGDSRNIGALLRHANEYQHTKLIVHIAKGILTGLRTLHENNIYHLDIKPENILFAIDGTVYIADFGCAKKLPDGKMKIFCGDAHYFSPERLRFYRRPQNKDVAEAFIEADKVDVWSFGLSLLAMILGKYPFDPVPLEEKLQCWDEEYFAGTFKKVPQLDNPKSNSYMTIVKGLLDSCPETRLGVTNALEQFSAHKAFDTVEEQRNTFTNLMLFAQSDNASDSANDTDRREQNLQDENGTDGYCGEEDYQPCYSR